MLPLVITIEGREGTRRYAFADSPIRIGRSPFAELQLTEPYVSRWEGTLRFDDNQVTYFPVSVTNPTYVDGKVAPGQEEVELGPQSVLAIGGFQLRFTREAVAEVDLRRKGKRQPVDSAGRVEAATVWLDARALLGGGDLQAHEAAQTDGSRQARAQPEAPAPSPMSTLTGAHREVKIFDLDAPPRPATTPTPAPRSSDSIRMLGTVRVSPDPDPAATHETKFMERPPSTRPAAASGSAARTIMMRSGDSSAPPRPESSHSSRPPPPGSVPPRAAASGYPPSPSTPPPPVGSPAELYQSYRQSFRALFETLSRELENAPERARAAMVAEMAQRYPQLLQESDFRALLRQLNVAYPRAEAPAVGDWLRDTLAGVLSPNIRVDTGLTLERVLALLETLTQSFAEINHAQDSIRRRWLGRAPRSSVLSSDEGRVILAYLLNPMSDWNGRLAELEESIRELIAHELALLRATLEGARGLLAAISPEAMAAAEGVELPSAESMADANGIWSRFVSKPPLELRLWKRFMSTYAELMESDRYQRVFLGRNFARSYLAAMGQQPEAETPRP